MNIELNNSQAEITRLKEQISRLTAENGNRTEYLN